MFMTSSKIAGMFLSLSVCKCTIIECCAACAPSILMLLNHFLSITTSQGPFRASKAVVASVCCQGEEGATAVSTSWVRHIVIYTMPTALCVAHLLHIFKVSCFMLHIRAMLAIFSFSLGNLSIVIPASNTNTCLISTELFYPTHTDRVSQSKRSASYIVTQLSYANDK
jgi:hypothetical protein